MAIEHSVGLDSAAAGGLGSPRRLIFGIVAVALFMSSIDSTIVATALLAIHTLGPVVGGVLVGYLSGSSVRLIGSRSFTPPPPR